jgi:hypothetical protein
MVQAISAQSTMEMDVLGSDWVEIADRPWSSGYIYRLIQRYPTEIKTALLSAGGKGGKRLDSRRSIDALIADLAEKQAADPQAKAERSKVYSDRRKGKKVKGSAETDVIDIDFA